ncbi:cation-translocating P-type ATPase [Enterococcus sp. BWR-S5]|uniref:cation-translocating P-type ATPase n=1 Tax=Enterococcus sp. BWR-S5 TaxID=2787714 RepID=UPI0019209299|nr:cation-translocating P-type ATPase [Enterococcus sp. BWR-S5]
MSSNKFEKKQGLTAQEVESRKQQGLQNDYEENVAKSTKDIIYDNVMTLFNFLNFAIAVFLFAVGAYSNLAFLAIILVNMGMGIYQEIHARNLVQKLSIVAKEDVTVIRDGQEVSIGTDELVMDDIVLISAGEQVPSDMKVIDGKAEANEALLTGESDLIEKTEGDVLLSGSFLSSGQVYAQVIHVGADNYAVKITSEAKVHKPIRSELIRSIRKVSKFTSYVIIPLGVILFIEGYFIRESGMKESVVASAAALLGMLPKGLVLLISIALTTGVIKLAKKRILVQDMYAMETLAHVDTLCLDKTGTITEGKMKVQHVHALNPKFNESLSLIIGSYLSESTDNNITMQAIRDHFELSNRYGAVKTIPFSSEKKWGAIQFNEIGTVVLGAPEKLFSEDRLPKEVFSAQEEGYRVLMMGIAEHGILDNEGTLPYLEPLVLLEIDDPIRQNANETLAYLREEGIDIKVISGDNPVTVSNIARRAGLVGYESYIDLSTKKTEEEVRQAVHEYTVFGRVSPQQKRTLVRELKDNQRVVAMTGDGVNDVLALREADCSIAMAEGDGATRQISNLVLLDSDFTTLPDVLFEGRRVVNNVTRVASVFFIKTIYSLILSVICALTAIAFPFIPIQITLIDLAIEGYPAFFLSFESDKRKVHGKFLPTALRNASVNAVLVVINIVTIYLIGENQGLNQLDTTTLMYYLLIGISCMAVVRACLPLNPLRIFLIVTTIGGIYVAAMLFHHILEVGFLTSTTLPIFAVMMVINIIVRVLIGMYKMKKNNLAVSDL